MRATVIIGVFCIMPLAFIGHPLRMNLFVASWFLIHSLLAYVFKRSLFFYDVVNALGFSILGYFFGTIMIGLRVRSFEDRRLLVIKGQTDALTGLYNRCKLFETLTQREIQPLSSIMMIDIDRFKEYNDRHGYIEADEAIQHLAAILQAMSAQACITFYRYGGEEFVGLASSLTEAELVAHAEALRLAVEQADKAVFAAKRDGHNRLVTLRAP